MESGWTWLTPPPYHEEQLEPSYTADGATILQTHLEVCYNIPLTYDTAILLQKAVKT